MSVVWICAIATSLAPGASARARFTVDGATTTPSNAVATIQPRIGAPGYSWLRIYFYSSPLSASDSAAAAKGRIQSVKAGWSAVLQLTLDKASTIWQVDLSVPGHTCTVAQSDQEAKTALPEFQFNGTHIRLAGKGSYVCDMKSLGIPNQSFAWDVNLDIPVVEGAPR